MQSVWPSPCEPQDCPEIRKDLMFPGSCSLQKNDMVEVVLEEWLAETFYAMNIESVMKQKNATESIEL